MGFKRDNVNNSFYMRPIPCGEKARGEAKQALMILEGVMRPCTIDQLAVEVKKLTLHCATAGRSEDDNNQFLKDYYSDLKQYPIKLIAEACKKYRLKSEGNNFMPQSGALIQLIQVKYGRMQAMKIRINKILGTHVEPEGNKNRPVSMVEALSELEK